MNPSQKLHLLTSFQYADKLLGEIESILPASSSKSAFPKYKPDISRAQEKIVRDYIGLIRSRMLRALESQGIHPPEAQFGSRRSITGTPNFRGRPSAGRSATPRSSAPPTRSPIPGSQAAAVLEQAAAEQAAPIAVLIKDLAEESAGALARTAAFNNLGKRLEAWVRQTLAELQARFDSYAHAYRSQLGHLIDHGPVADALGSFSEP